MVFDKVVESILEKFDKFVHTAALHRLYFVEEVDRNAKERDRESARRKEGSVGIITIM
jgi:hypothetical protein